MKKIALSLAAMAATLGFNACTKSETVPAEPSAKGEFSIYADFTKTVNDDMNTKWAAGDAINLFHAAGTDTSSNNMFTISEEDLASGRFTGNLTEELAESNDWYAFYPYSNKLTKLVNKNCFFNIGCKNSHNTAQSQDGNSNMSHLAGQYFPLYAQAKGVAKDAQVSLSFKPVLSVVKFTVTNNTKAALVVNSVSLTADRDIIGSYYVDFSGESPVFTPSGATYVTKTASLSVTNGEEISVGESEDFYFAVIPFSNAEGHTLTFSVNGYDKTSTAAAEFKAGKIKTVNFSYDKEDKPQVFPYEEKTLSTFSIENVNVPSELGAVWTATAEYMKATGYKSKCYESESWLVSPKIDLTDASAVTLSFDHALNMLYSGTITDHIALYVKEYDGENEGEWKPETINTYPKGSDWTFYTNTTSLYSHIGKIIRVGFKYISNTSVAPTWEIKNFKLDVPPATTIAFGKEAVTLKPSDSFDNPASTNSPATVSYVSSNVAVATVDASGTITAVADGNCTITASVEACQGYAAAETSCAVTVSSAKAEVKATAKFGSAEGSINVKSASASGNDDQNNTWTVVTEGTESFSPNAAYSQIGASKKPASSITFTTSLPSDATFKSLSAKFGGFSGTAGSISVKVGDTEVGTGSLSGSADVVVSSTKTAEGTAVTISVSDIAKGVKIYSIELVYER